MEDVQKLKIQMTRQSVHEYHTKNYKRKRVMSSAHTMTDIPEEYTIPVSEQCRRCTRRRMNGSDLCKHHLEIAKRLQLRQMTMTCV